MDGYKKIGHTGLLLLIFLLLNACGIQKPAGVSLFETVPSETPMDEPAGEEEGVLLPGEGMFAREPADQIPPPDQADAGPAVPHLSALNETIDRVIANQEVLIARTDAIEHALSRMEVQKEERKTVVMDTGVVMKERAVPDTVFIVKEVELQDTMVVMKERAVPDTVFIVKEVEVQDTRVVMTKERAVPDTVFIVKEVELQDTGVVMKERAVPDTVFIVKEIELQDTGVVMTKERPVTDTVFVVREKVIRERDTVFIIREVPVPDTAQMRKSLRDGKVLRELSGKLKVRSDSLRILKEDLVQLERDLMQPGQMVLPDTLFFTLYYDSDSFEARNREEIMQDIRDVTQHKKVVRIFVSGYTDSRGTPEVNLVISNRRVLAVSDQLRELGIDRRLIYNQHFGDAYASELPLDTDRRVDIVILAEDL